MLASEEFIIKICGITTEADALMCVSQGANAIGFVFAPSIRQMVPGEALGCFAMRIKFELSRLQKR